MSELEDRERKNFAEMLHEDIGQNLFAMNLAWSSVKKVLKSSSSGLCEFSDEIDVILKDTISATRRLTSKLYPALPEGITVADAVAWYGDTLLKRSGAELVVRISKGIEGLPQAQKECLVRVVRESFQNISKHSGAGKVTLVLKLGEESVELLISDDGGGSPFKVKKKKGRGIGLMLMRERVKELGGEFHMVSELNKGTRVELMLPVVTAEEERRAK